MKSKPENLELYSAQEYMESLFAFCKISSFWSLEQVLVMIFYDRIPFAQDGAIKKVAPQVFSSHPLIYNFAELLKNHFSTDNTSDAMKWLGIRLDAKKLCRFLQDEKVLEVIQKRGGQVKRDFYALVEFVCEKNLELENVFRKTGEYWDISYSGESGHFANTDGFHYIHYLAKRPLQEISVKEIYNSIYGDSDRKSKETDEISWAYQNVSKGIRNAIGRIKSQHPVLGEHLESTIKTGKNCSYRPDSSNPPQWNL